MDTAYQILELGDDLNRLVGLKRKSRESYIENCKGIIDSYCFFYQQSETDYILALQSINNSLEELNFGSNQFIDISKISSLLVDYTKVYIDSIKKSVEYYSDLDFVFGRMQNIIKIDFEENRTNSTNFNALTFFNIDETLHSRLIVKLLNPKSEHGQEKLFLKEFLRLLEIDEPDKGEWRITAETGRIDILLKRDNPESVIIVENKSNGAIDQQNQLYRYWHKEIYLKTKEVDSSFYETNRNRYRIIYMPPDLFKYPDIHSLQKPQDENWSKLIELPDKMPIEYEIRPFNDFVVQWLNKCLDIIPKTNHRMTEFLKQYFEICNNL